MAADDDGAARARPRDLVDVVHDAPAEDPDRRPGARRPARRWVPLVALAVPVVAVAAVLGVQAAGGTFDLDAAVTRVSESSDGLMPSGSDYRFGSTGSAGPDVGLTGGSSDPPGGPREVTVLCASERGRGAHLTVTAGGEVLGEADVACSNGADLDAEPLVTVLPLDDLSGSWSFEVLPGTQAAVAVVLS